MAFHRAKSVVMLLAPASIATTVGAEETVADARIEATIPRFGYFIGVGVD